MYKLYTRLCIQRQIIKIGLKYNIIFLIFSYINTNIIIFFIFLEVSSRAVLFRRFILTKPYLIQYAFIAGNVIIMHGSELVGVVALR